MGLRLVTGPVNASKAGEVLQAVRDWLAQGREPVLVVPTGPDADRYRRELLRDRDGFVTGLTVGPFTRLEELVREAVAVAPQTVGPVAMERLLISAAGQLEPRRPLRTAATRAKVRRRLAALLDELAELGASVEVLAQELKRPELSEHGLDPALLADLELVLGTVAGGKEGRPSPRTSGVVALQTRRALAADPALWRRPIALYGFDDLTGQQLRLISTLSRATDVVISIPFEDGRPGTEARKPVVQELRALATEPESKAERMTAGPAGISRIALRLFAADSQAQSALAAPSNAEAEVADVVNIEAPDARSEAEAIAEQVIRSVNESELQWHDVAIAVRDSAGVAGARIERELAARGLSCSRLRRIRATQTEVGYAIHALASLAAMATTETAGAADSDYESLQGAQWVLAAAAAFTEASTRDAISQVEIGLSREGQNTAAMALAGLSASGIESAGLQLAIGAIEADPQQIGEVLKLLSTAVATFEKQLQRERRTDLQLGRATELKTANMLGTHLKALADVSEAGVGALIKTSELAAEIADIEVETGEQPGLGRVEIAEPQALRGRQLKLLVLAGLEESAFPAPDPIDPLIDRDARQALSAAGSVTLEAPAPRLAAERMLFLELVSQPTRLLVLSRALRNEKGDERPASPFLIELLAALDPLKPVTVTPQASQVLRVPATSPARGNEAVPFATGLEAAQREEIAATLAKHQQMSVSEVENLVRCPVCWLLESYGKAIDASPTTEAQIAGTLIHQALQLAISQVAGDGRKYGQVEPQRFVEAGEAAVLQLAPARTAALPEHRAKVLTKRANVAVGAVLAALPEQFKESRFHAAEVEVGSRENAQLPALQLAGGVSASGRIDRVDFVDGDTAAVGVVDYKLSEGSGRGAAKWQDTGTLQVALYLQAASVGFARAPGYGVYQSSTPSMGVRTELKKASGAWAKEAGGSAHHTNKFETTADVQAVVDEALEIAGTAILRMQSGALEPDPELSVHAREGNCRQAAVARLIGLSVLDEGDVQ